MTRKDYNLFPALFADHYYWLRTSFNWPQKVSENIVTDLILRTGKALKADNSAFDEAKFANACEKALFSAKAVLFDV